MRASQVPSKGQLERITRRNNPLNLATVGADLIPVLQGFAVYLRLAKRQGHVRRTGRMNLSSSAGQATRFREKD